eukprot:scaffold293542_cov36-Tisochrysis_lutea.AAC.3
MFTSSSSSSSSVRASPPNSNRIHSRGGDGGTPLRVSGGMRTGPKPRSDFLLPGGKRSLELFTANWRAMRTSSQQGGRLLGVPVPSPATDRLPASISAASLSAASTSP